MGVDTRKSPVRLVPCGDGILFGKLAGLMKGDRGLICYQISLKSMMELNPDEQGITRAPILQEESLLPNPIRTMLYECDPCSKLCYARLTK